MQKNWIETIKESLTIREVVEHYCGRAVRNKVKSPFNVEKTPSLHIYDKTQTFRDFSSDSGGDIFDFIEKLFSCNTKQAGEIVAKDFGISLNKFNNLDSKELEIKRLERVKKERERRYKEEKLRELRNKIIDHLRMFEQIKQDTKPYSPKNLGYYRQHNDCNLHIWAIKNLDRLDYLYSAVAGLQVEYIAKDLELIGFYVYDKKEQEKRQELLLQNYLNGQLDLII